jgi:hypothetical protein
MPILKAKDASRPSAVSDFLCGTLRPASLRCVHFFSQITQNCTENAYERHVVCVFLLCDLRILSGCILHFNSGRNQGCISDADNTLVCLCKFRLRSCFFTAVALRREGPRIRPQAVSDFLCGTLRPRDFYAVCAFASPITQNREESLCHPCSYLCSNCWMRFSSGCDSLGTRIFPSFPMIKCEGRL